MQAKKDFTYSEGNQEYIIQLKKKSYWWLWLFLLLLLPLILLIRFEKTVVFKTVSSPDKSPLSKALVEFSYKEHNLLKAVQTHTYKDSTNKDGLVYFKKISYTLFQQFFFAKEKALVKATGGCFMGDSLNPLFFDLKDNVPTELVLPIRTYDLSFQVVDRDDGQPIPDATVIGMCPPGSNDKKWNEKTNANGMVELKGLPYCSEIKVIGSAYGYLNDTLKNHVKFLTGDLKSRTLRLKPIKDMVKFLVKDLYSKEPLPNALALLIIEKDTMRITTNTNGVGKGVFENIRIVKEMRIKASHVFYHDTITPVYKVENYVKLSEGQRTIYLRPEVQNLVFRDVDGTNGNPIEGANNVITINGQQKGTEMSNANGTFIVAGLRPTDRLSILASKSGYGSNDYTINNKLASELNTQNSRDIPLRFNPPPPPPPPGPRVGCRAYFAGTLVSDEPIDGHISVIYQVDKYSEYVGEGEYTDNSKAFPRAVATTFDGIAVDKGTRIVIYSGKNFTGNVLLDITGPAIINNLKWRENQYIKDFQSKQFRADLHANFPPSCRSWSTSNMNDWDHGSLKVICNQ